MRWVSLTVGCLLACSACGDDAGEPTACEVGPEIMSAATALVRNDQPACARDEECVYVRLDVDCAGYSTVGCGEVVHREAAARWDGEQVCRDIDRASVPGPFHCGTEAACAARGTPVCRSGRCVGSADD